MKVFVVNCGSSSLKYQLFDMKGEEVLAKGLVERIGIEGSVLKHSPEGKDSVVINQEIPNHSVAIQLVLDALLDEKHGVIKSLSEINACGHRVAHGGEKFKGSALINKATKDEIQACAMMAPLHNPANLLGITVCEELMPNVPQVAVFDTAFHQTMPEYVYLYALPYEIYTKYRLRKYGFHGTSHKYVAEKAAEAMGKDIKDLRIVTCHLGNGASVTAVNKGKSMDTSMGYTPMEGLAMGTRVGDVDPAVVPFLMKHENLSAQGVEDLMNKKSGVLGLSGVSSDFRDIEDAAAAGNDRAQLALDVFAYKVKKYIGSFVAVMGGVDAIVFTAGLGENAIGMRAKICEGLEFLGTKIDAERNNVRGKLREISEEGSKVKLFLIPTNEELVIARDTKEICEKL